MSIDESVIIITPFLAIFTNYFTSYQKNNCQLSRKNRFCLVFAQSPPPLKGVARGAGCNPLTPDSVSRRLDFLSVQVTIALDALLIPLKGCLYYFDLTLERVFIFFDTQFILHNVILFLILNIFLDCRFI